MSLTVIVLTAIVALVAIVAIVFGRDVYTRWRSDEFVFKAETDPSLRNVTASNSGGETKIPSSAADDMNTPKE